MKWVTRARPKVDRVACPWLITAFVDPQAGFLYVPPDEVRWSAGSRHTTGRKPPLSATSTETNLDSLLDRQSFSNGAIDGRKERFDFFQAVNDFDNDRQIVDKRRIFVL